jgi:hypothetical protein
MIRAAGWIGLTALGLVVACGTTPPGGSAGAANTDGNASGGGGGTRASTDPEFGISPQGEPPGVPAGGAGVELSPDGSAGAGPLPEDGGLEDASTQVLCPATPRADWSLTAVVAGANITASATAAREALAQGLAPLPRDIRPQDFVNYYPPDLPAAIEGRPSLHVQLRATRVPSYYELLVAVRAPEAAPRPAALTFVIDNTQSLGSEGLARAQAALRAISARLGDGDRLDLIDAGSATRRSFEPGSQQQELASAIDALELAPERAVEDLLALALEPSSSNAATDSNNRVILLADGEGNAEKVNVPEGGAHDVRVVAIGVGPRVPHGHRLLRRVSRLGRGPYLHLDSVAEAEKLGSPAGLASLLGVALDQVKVHIDVPWYFAVERPFPGDVTSEVASIEPQYLAPGGVMVLLFRLKACDPAAVGTPDAPATLPRARVTYSVNGLAGSVDEFQLTLGNGPSAVLPLAKAFAVLDYAEALRSLDTNRLDAALGQVRELEPLAADADLAEISGLLSAHPATSR